ncbi:hypothetical protein SDC9_201156 [bioreactor metagenome]|uniref:Uncharacterized protein n=1 Tax=bioreactor metagenome TaxID=1076179 RepID=A0A645IRN9_9ZZZZ
MATVFVGSPLARRTVVVQIQHGGHRIHPQPINVINLQPEAGGREKKAHYLRPPIVKNPCPPSRVFPLFRVGIFVAAGSVELIQPLLILAEMGGNPVQDHGNAILVHMVYKPHKVLGRSIPGGGREIPGALIAP